MRPVTERQRAVRDMFASIAHRYDLLNRLLSFRRDVAWRRHAVRAARVGAGARVLDLCAGTADVACEVLRQQPDVVVVAADNCEPMLAIGRRKAAARGLDAQLILTAAAAEEIPFHPESFDATLIAFGIRNVADRPAVMKELYRVLKPGGRAVILEFSTPGGVFLGPLYRFYSHRILPWIGGLLSGNPAAYRYLPESVDSFPTPMALAKEIERAGFSQVEFFHLTGGIVTIHIGAKSS